MLHIFKFEYKNILYELYLGLPTNNRVSIRIMSDNFSFFIMNLLIENDKIIWGENIPIEVGRYFDKVFVLKSFL